ncbi:MAG: SGNH/GDSL hydrolase family protein [Lachnospiraceae bacterium]|nr:SGNH/GDSL hydrolase family protein [Lachnospiraceae bacterium]
MKKILKGIGTGLLAVLILIGLGYEISKPVKSLTYTYLKNRASAYAADIKVGVLGDSIWGNVQDETGVAAVVERELGVEVYNCAIGGTQAAYNWAEIEGRPDQSLMVITNQVIYGEAAYDNSELNQYYLEVNWQEMDYIIFSYGVNDYYAGVFCEGEDPYNPNTYAGAIRTALEAWQEYAPQATFILCAQNLTQLHSYGKIAGDSDEINYGGGTGPDYVNALKRVAAEYESVIFINTYEDITIDRANGNVLLEDGTHFSEYGREVYAKNIVRYLAKDLIAKNG